MPRKVIVRSSDTDVLVLLIAIIAREVKKGTKKIEQIIIDYGLGSNRRYIELSSITESFASESDGLPEAVIGFHAFTGCDYTSSFLKKGKSKAFAILRKDKGYVEVFKSLCTEHPDDAGINRFVCHLYGENDAIDANDARYQKVMRFSQSKLNAKFIYVKSSTRPKSLNRSSLPPCRKTLRQKILRCKMISKMWHKADTKEPAAGLDPLSHGWTN